MCDNNPRRGRYTVDTFNHWRYICDVYDAGRETKAFEMLKQSFDMGPSICMKILRPENRQHVEIVDGCLVINEPELSEVASAEIKVIGIDDSITDHAGEHFYSITKGMRGWFAVELWVNDEEPDLGLFVEPYQSDFASYDNPQAAFIRARQLAEQTELPLLATTHCHECGGEFPVPTGDTAVCGLCGD